MTKFLWESIKVQYPLQPFSELTMESTTLLSPLRLILLITFHIYSCFQNPAQLLHTII